MLRILVLYDIPGDRARGHVADACLDYGLERIQYSAFIGALGRAHRHELMLRIERLLGREPAKVRFILLDDIAWRTQHVIERDTPRDTPHQEREPSAATEPGHDTSNDAVDATSREDLGDDSGWPA